MRYKQCIIVALMLAILAGCAGKQVKLETYNATARALDEATHRIQALQQQRDNCRKEKVHSEGMLEACLDQDAVQEREVEGLQVTHDRILSELERCADEIKENKTELESEEELKDVCTKLSNTQKIKIDRLLKTREVLKTKAKILEEKNVALVKQLETMGSMLKRLQEKPVKEAQQIRDYIQTQWLPWAKQFLADKGIEALVVRNRDTEVLFELKAKDLFHAGTASVTKTAGRVVGVVAQIMKQWPGLVAVEGHTDDLPPGEQMKKRFPSNWELSAARAASVTRVMVNGYSLPAKKVRVEAYAASGTEDGKEAENRKVVIRGYGADLAKVPTPEPKKGL